MSNLIGIDLGTSYSVVSTLDHTGRPVIVHNQNGGNMTASVVSFLGGDSVDVGVGARNQLHVDPDTLGRFKRDMGTSVTYEAGGELRTPTDLSALVLRKLKQDSEKALGGIDEAVITIPANFSHEAREATMQAAQLAGLRTRYIINEPTAAALYYAHVQGQSLDGVYVVFDLGGGTFDVSVIRVTDEDIEVLATNGIGRLGGDDFDVALQTLVKNEFEKRTSVVLADADYSRQDAERDKLSLSNREKILTRTSSAGHRENIEITREMFEQSISTMVTQTVMLGEATLLEAGVSAQDVQAVFLAGGSTRIPLVRTSVERAFGQAPIISANVDEVVALGAALYAAYKGDPRLLNSVQQRVIQKINVTERTAKCFGVISIGLDQNLGRYSLENAVLITKGSILPASVDEIFHTVHDGQSSVDCQVTESASPERDPKFVKVIWKGDLALPEGRPAGQEIKITFSYDDNQVMNCSFQDMETGKTTDIDLHMASGSEGDHSEDIERFTVE